MSKIVEGVYRNGKVDLTQKPDDVRDETRVIVTFPEPSEINLQARGIEESQATDLRARLAVFAEDWESPEMNAYDNYDAAKACL